MIRLSFDEEALAEFEGAAAYYEDERPGIGEEFLQAVERRLSHICEMPEMFPQVLDLPAELSLA